jgi:hypothetical protein
MGRSQKGVGPAEYNSTNRVAISIFSLYVPPPPPSLSLSLNLYLPVGSRYMCVLYYLPNYLPTNVCMEPNPTTGKKAWSSLHTSQINYIIVYLGVYFLMA